MDKVKAADWETRLEGKEIGGFEVIKLIDFGKSAAVFRARGGREEVALKIFDDELIERYGDKVQLGRIERELTLIGKTHRNMVRILDGGIDKNSGNHFIAMEYLSGDNLEKCLKEIPEANIPMLVEQLASACEFLETLGLAHRDIKPSNIVLLDDYTRLVLLDFGVLKPVGEVGLTDHGGIQSFIGTLQYSSPEFLLRQENDSIDGWRALSIYQIGGVLHDLIMRKPLFQDFVNPYGRLVMAVQNDTPSVVSSTTPSYLIETCKAALVKSPRTRLQLVSWQSFRAPKRTTSGAAARERVTRRAAVSQATVVMSPSNGAGSSELINAIIDFIKIDARRVRNGDTSAFPPLTIARNPPTCDCVTISFRESVQQTLPSGLTLGLRVEVVDSVASAISIKACAWLGSIGNKPEIVPEVEAFRGVFVAASLSTLLEDLMYMAVDKGQSNDAELPTHLQLSELERLA